MKDPLDFLRKGRVDLKNVNHYVESLGYKPYNLVQNYRHITGLVTKDGVDYFFKMASRQGLSVFIENEFAWCHAVKDRKISEDWPFLIPTMFGEGKMDGLSWFLCTYIPGKDAKDDPSILNEVAKPTAHLIRTILTTPLKEGLPLDKERGNLSEKSKLLAKIISYEEKASKNIPDLFKFLRDNISWLQAAPARGDLGAGSFRKDNDNRIWLIDSEYAMQRNIKFYDLVYFYYRLYVNAERPDLAESFMSEFRKIYEISKNDEKIIKWMLVYRIIGGYNEAKSDPQLLPRIKKFHKKTARLL